jgi:hypothetical protein
LGITWKRVCIHSINQAHSAASRGIPATLGVDSFGSLLHQLPA